MCLPASGDWEIGPWPDGVTVQIRGMDADEFFAGEGDVEAARSIPSPTRTCSSSPATGTCSWIPRCRPTTRRRRGCWKTGLLEFLGRV
ncbi:MAG TPA: hypothetical protein VFZ37_21980 [Jiangellaceae bacterium]